MDLGLDGKVALVTGASKGIGRGIAAELVAEGARVAISSSSPERIEATAAALGATAFVHDTKDLDATAALVAQVEERLGPIDILVCNTGGPPSGPDALSFTREQWQQAYASLVLGPMALIEAVLPGMRARRFGRIVNVAPTGVREPLPNLMLSNAHRPSMIGAFKTLARQVAADGVTLNSVLPGRIDTDRIAQLMARGRPRRRPLAPTSRPSAWARSRSSRPSPPSCARPAPATSPARPSPSTAALPRRCSSQRGVDVGRDRQRPVEARQLQGVEHGLGDPGEHEVEALVPRALLLGHGEGEARRVDEGDGRELEDDALVGPLESPDGIREGRHRRDVELPRHPHHRASRVAVDRDVELRGHDFSHQAASGPRYHARVGATRR